MPKIHIKIGDVKTLTVSGWEITPDDRQTLIETIGGVICQDFGLIPEGEKISCEVTIRVEDAATLYSYWHDRTLVTVEDAAGSAYSNMRVRVKSYSYLEGFTKYLKVKLEFWRV